MESGSSSTTDSDNEEADRNAELEEMMVTQRREILWLKKEMESQTVELTTLRKEVHELKRERRKHNKLIDRQKRTIDESTDRVQTLRSLLAQPKSSASLEKSASPPPSATSLAEDTLIHESDAENGGDSPESESTARSKREHPVGGSAEEK